MDVAFKKGSITDNGGVIRVCLGSEPAGEELLQRIQACDGTYRLDGGLAFAEFAYTTTALVFRDGFMQDQAHDCEIRQEVPVREPLEEDPGIDPDVGTVGSPADVDGMGSLDIPVPAPEDIPDPLTIRAENLVSDMEGLSREVSLLLSELRIVTSLRADLSDEAKEQLKDLPEEFCRHVDDYFKRVFDHKVSRIEQDINDMVYRAHHRCDSISQSMLDDLDKIIRSAQDRADHLYDRNRGLWVSGSILFCFYFVLVLSLCTAAYCLSLLGDRQLAVSFLFLVLGVFPLVMGLHYLLPRLWRVVNGMRMFRKKPKPMRPW